MIIKGGFGVSLVGFEVLLETHAFYKLGTYVKYAA